MIGPNNWVMVKCSNEGCMSPEWLMHWPCEGSEDEIRNGKHYCVACQRKEWEAKAEADPVRHYPVTLPEVVFQDEEAEESGLGKDLRQIARSLNKKGLARSQ